MKTHKEILETIRNEASFAIHKEREDMKKWIDKLNRDPVYAFEWGCGAFDTAAAMHILTYIIDVCDHCIETNHPLTEEEVRAAMNKEFFRRAEKIGGSTSASHNLMGKALVEAYAKFLRPDAWGSGFNLKSMFRHMKEKENA